MPYEEQIVSALLAIKDDIGGMRSDIRTLYKKVDDLAEERRRSDETRKREDDQIREDQDILAQRVVDLEQTRDKAKWLVRLGLLLTAVLGGGLGSKVSGWISKIWPG